jgi:subtilisin family serine protease
VTIYILDSGIRASHQEFQPWEGSATRVTVGPDFVDNDAAADDCDGHGTHVASTGELA